MKKKCQPHVKLIKSIINHAWPFSSSVAWWNKILVQHIDERKKNNKWYECNIDATRGICFQCYLLLGNFYFYTFHVFFCSLHKHKNEIQKKIFCCCCSHGIGTVTTKWEREKVQKWKAFATNFSELYTFLCFFEP